MSALESIDTLAPTHDGGAVDEPQTGPGVRLSASASGSVPVADPDLSGALELRAGDLVSDRYMIESLLGCGGHGAIYRARHTELDLPLAIKVVHTRGAQPPHPELLQRFLREARIAARIRHRNVLSVYDAGRMSDGSPYLAMELIEGEDLERRILRGPLTIAAIVDLGRQLYASITAIAEAGVLHRDVKPANVMLHREIDGHVLVKLVDFGIARSHAELEKLTVTGTVVGTPHYMSAEQLRGEPLDARADMYSAAAVLYEATTGRPPFDGAATALVIGQILTASFAPVRTLRPDCPEELARIIEHGLARKRGERPSHPLQVVAALDRIASTLGLPTGALAWAGDPAMSRTQPIALARRRAPTPVPDVEVPGELPVLPSPVDDPQPAHTPHRPDEIDDPPPQIPPRRARRRWIAGATLVAAAALAWMVVGEAPSSPAVANASVPPTKTATTISPDATTRDEVGRLLQSGLESLARDEVDAALAHYRAASALAPTRPEAQRGLGVAAARAGLDDEAIAAFERYLALAPDATDADRVRERIAAVRAHRSEQIARGAQHARATRPAHRSRQ